MGTMLGTMLPLDGDAAASQTSHAEAQWFAVYRIADGALVSRGTVIANPLPVGLAAVPTTPPSDAGEVWDADLLTFVVPPPVTRAVLSPLEFAGRFTDAEEDAVFALRTDPASPLPVRAALERLDRRQTLARDVDVTDPRTIAGVHAVVGLLAQLRPDVVPPESVAGRIAAILAPVVI